MKGPNKILLASVILIGAALIFARLVSTVDKEPGKLNADLSASAKTQPAPGAQPELTEKAEARVAADEKTKVATETRAQHRAATQSQTPAEAETQSLANEKTKRRVEIEPEQAVDVDPGPAAITKLAQLVRNEPGQPPLDSYHASQWNPIHFKPEIDKATDAQCLACHSEILSRKVRDAAPAGLKTKDALAWYQTLDTYTGEQQTFHARHLTTAFAKQVMSLKCNFCHQGHDPREEAPGSSAMRAAPGDFTLRKEVNPEKSCLMCHGRFPAETMGLEGTWAELREGLENEETANGCLMCHAEQFRTVRHRVNYLKPKAIEKLAKEGTSDVCYGCHGGRAWYNISYPYPRHPWPGMEDVVEGTPEWAKERPTQSDPRFQIDSK